jgi:cytochrome c oxidase cbb3-type subunit 3
MHTCSRMRLLLPLLAASCRAGFVDGRQRTGRTRLPILLALTIAAGACTREERRFSDLAALSVPARSEHAAPLHVAALQPYAARSSALSFDPYDGNAWAVSEGKRYFTWFNCNGCHGQGGGAFGPALMDNRWRYGHEPAQLYSSIVDGRAGGMPSFAGKLTEQQVWRLVAYVRALGGFLRLDVLPGRSDTLSGRAPESMMHHARDEAWGLHGSEP